MKNRKTLLMVLSLVLASVLLAGCTGSPGTAVGTQTSIAGKWTHPDMGYQKGIAAFGSASSPVTYEFTGDGKILMGFDGKSFTELATQQMASIGLPENQMNAVLAAVPEMSYTLDGRNITILIKTGSETVEHSGEFKLENNTLTLPGFGADTLTLTRAE